MNGLGPKRNGSQTGVDAFSHSLNSWFSFADWAKLLSCGFALMGAKRCESAIGVHRHKPLDKPRLNAAQARQSTAKTIGKPGVGERNGKVLALPFPLRQRFAWLWSVLGFSPGAARGSAPPKGRQLWKIFVSWTRLTWLPPYEVAS